MIKPEPVPESLLARSLHQAFTTDEWPGWDNLDLVPESMGTSEDDFDFDHGADTDDSTELPDDQGFVEDAQDPAEQEAPDFGLNSSEDGLPAAEETDFGLPEGERSDDNSTFNSEDTFDF